MNGITPSRTLFGRKLPERLPIVASKVLAIHDWLAMFERLERDRQDSFLSARLNSLLTHAKRYSPFWKERLRSLSPGKHELHETLETIPVLLRSDLQSHHDEIIADFPGKKNYRVTKASTSGSTGIPVRMEQLQEIKKPPQLASNLVEARWHNLDPMKSMGVIRKKFKDLESFAWGQPFNWYGPVGTGFSRCSKDEEDRDREYSELYEYCALKKPSYLYSGTSMLTGLARYAIENGCRDLRPEAVFSYASVVTEDMRETVREGLGAKVIDRYSAEETGMIARQCPKHNHLHVLSPITLMEIVDENDAPCSVGQPGRVLVTAMQSYGMPLIRYEIGDVAEWGETCDCGITLPVIKKLWGRTSQLITNPDGRTAFARIYARDFEDLRDIQEYRFVLHKNDVVVAQLKVKASSQELTSAVTERVQRALGYPYPVNVQYVEEIDWGSSWKKDNFSVSDAPAPEMTSG